MNDVVLIDQIEEFTDICPNNFNSDIYNDDGMFQQKEKNSFEILRAELQHLQ